MMWSTTIKNVACTNWISKLSSKAFTCFVPPLQYSDVVVRKKVSTIIIPLLKYIKYIINIKAFWCLFELMIILVKTFVVREDASIIRLQNPHQIF